MKNVLFFFLISFGIAQAQSTSTFSSPDPARLRELQELQEASARGSRILNCSSFPVSEKVSKIGKCFTTAPICLSSVAMEIQITPAGQKPTILRSTRDGYINRASNCIAFLFEKVEMPTSVTNLKSSMRKNDGSLDLEFTFKGKNIKVNVPMGVEADRMGNDGFGVMIFQGSSSIGTRGSDKISVRLRIFQDGLPG